MKIKSLIIRKLQLIICLSIISINLYSQNFSEVEGIFPEIMYSHVQFLDFDGDDDLDIYVWGYYKNTNSRHQLVVFENKGQNQFESQTVESLINYGSTTSFVGSADINNDNIPEMVAIGGDDYYLHFTQYRNNAFEQISGPGLGDIGSNSYQGFWLADYDNDGSDELLSRMKIYDTYKQIFPPASFENIRSECSLWIDVNNDGYSDILRIHAQQYVDKAVSNIYINDGSGGFEEKSFDYDKRVWSVTTGDYNNDGYEDVMLTSHPAASTHSIDLYKNDKNGNFIHVREFPNALTSKFVDVDNDGDLDIAILGHYDVYGKYYIQFYINNGDDNFVASDNKNTVSSDVGNIEVADYDKDGDVDLLISSHESLDEGYPKLLKNNLVEGDPLKANTKPSVPKNLKATVNFNNVRLEWDQSTDNETPKESLTYNVYIQREDGSYLTSPIANITNGFQRIIQKGNAGYKNFYEINCLSDGTYYWSVQAIDNSNLGSTFATKGSFEIRGTLPAPPSNLVATTISDTEIQLEWEDNSVIESGFIIEMYSEDYPYQKSPGFYERKVVEAESSSCIIEGLEPETEYIFRVKAYNCSATSDATNEDTITTYPIPFTKEILLYNHYGHGAEWGDFDNDGDLDILLFYKGDDSYDKQKASILENVSGRFGAMAVSFSDFEYSGYSSNTSLNWVDFNSDGLLDVCSIKGCTMKLFKNNGDKSFTEVDSNGDLSILPGSCGPSFADYDNDGDMDMLLMGQDSQTFNYKIIVFDNDGAGRFVKSNIKREDVYIKSRAPWCDFNGDGYLDILAFSKLENGKYIVVILKNNGDKSFTKLSFDYLPGLNTDVRNQAGDMRWGDYNNDGYPDILISGAHTGSTGSGFTRIYENNGDESFSDTGIDNIYGMAHDVSIEWGDYNNDGTLDILQSGDGWINGVIGRTRIFYNKNGMFEKESKEYFLNNHQYGMSTAADYDNDGDLDILNLGEISYIHSQIALFNNFQPFKNTKPDVPSNLRVRHVDDEVILEWDRADDDETPSMGLSYNVYLKDDNGYVILPHSISTGKRTIVAMGNAQQNNFIKIKGLKDGEYTWSVQSIDHCFEGSSFADEVKFSHIVMGIEDEKKQESDYKISPNPCTANLNISGGDKDDSPCSIVVNNSMGRQLIKKNNIHLPYNIDMSSLRPGIYFITIYHSNSTFVKKIIKK